MMRARYSLIITNQLTIGRRGSCVAGLGWESRGVENEDHGLK
jgi:hypothetical protein